MKNSLEETVKKTLWDLYEVLKAVVDIWLKTLQSDFDDQFARRAAIRATFGFIEGAIYGVKQLTLAKPTNKSYSFTPAEEAMLREENYEIDDKGKARGRKAKQVLAKNMLFAFDTFARMLRNTSPINTKEDSGWSDFQDAIKIRDRLMHPKSANDLNITDEEVQKVNKVYLWFHERFVTLLTDSDVTSQNTNRS